VGGRMVPIALVVVASIMGRAAHGPAIELGELHAVPSHSPPHLFRLPLLAPPHAASVRAEVTVRHPADTLAFVKHRMVELRLRTLADVELEVSFAGQTLNRLILRSELQAAQMRAEWVSASNLFLPAKAKGRDRQWSEAMPSVQQAAGASDHSLIEREMEGIRQEIHTLVARVAPWQGATPLEEPRVGVPVAAVLMLVLGGCFIVAVASLTLGSMLQGRAIARQQRRREALTVAIRQMRDQQAVEASILPALPPVPQSQAPNEALVPVAMMHRVRVVQKTRRRLRLWAPGNRRSLAPQQDVKPLRPQARTCRPGSSTPAELLHALAQLRGELMRLQGEPSAAFRVHHTAAASRQVTR
jgi:hypothetical protein